jgi:hypothetical protein
MQYLVLSQQIEEKRLENEILPFVIHREKTLSSLVVKNKKINHKGSQSKAQIDTKTKED